MCIRDRYNSSCHFDREGVKRFCVDVCRTFYSSMAQFRYRTAAHGGEKRPKKYAAHGEGEVLNKCVRTKKRGTKKRGTSLCEIVRSFHSRGHTLGKYPPLELVDDALRALLAVPPPSFELSCFIVSIAVMPPPNRRAISAYDTF